MTGPHNVRSIPNVGETASASERTRATALERVRTVWWYGLAGLWLLDGLLQAQPSMFTRDGMVGNVLLPAAQGQPSWISTPMQWGIHLWEWSPVLWNAGVVGLELLIGGLLLFGRGQRVWGYAGLVLSVVWGLAVWYLGEGLGGLFTGSPTYLAGAPGSALLYALLASLLLLPDTAWSSLQMLRGLQVGGAIAWGVGGLLQLAPLYWSPLGLASVLQNVAMMPLPFGLAALDTRLIASMAQSPVVWNAALALLFLGPALALLFARCSRSLYLLLVASVVFVWVVFEGCGMVFGAMATDPNTPPLWALLLLPTWFVAGEMVTSSARLPSRSPALVRRLLVHTGRTTTD